MHQTKLTADGTAASSPRAAFPRLEREPRWVRVGRGTYPFSTYAAASAAYRATIEHFDVGISAAPVCEVLDEMGNALARVAFNGRVFAVGPDGECDYTCVLHEICGD